MVFIEVYAAPITLSRATGAKISSGIILFSTPLHTA